MNDLIDRLEALLKQRAPLWALYGPGGTFDNTRKILLATCRTSKRIELQELGERYTESMLDDLGRMDGSYKKLIARASEEREQLANLDAEITAIEHRISYMRAQTYENAQLARMQ